MATIWSLLAVFRPLHQMYDSWNQEIYTFWNVQLHQLEHIYRIYELQGGVALHR